MYQWRHGAPPSSVEEQHLQLEDEDETGDENQDIDWGDLGGEEEIDFGSGDGGDIDWGVSGGDGVVIEVMDDSTAGTANDDGVARGSDALTILDNSETRGDIVNDLLELSSFLEQRIAELSSPADVLSSAQFESAPAGLQQIDLATVTNMQTEVTKILGNLNSSKMQELILIRSSPRYVERVTSSLKKSLDDAEKAMSLSRLMVTRQQEALDEEVLLQPRLALIRSKTQHLKSQIEGEISNKYQNRRVNIMGEINTI